MFTQFRIKLAVIFVSLFLAIQAVQFFVLYVAIEGNTSNQVFDQLDTSSRIFTRLYRERAEQLQTSVQLLARDFGFREAVATHDRATVTAALESVLDRIDNASLAAVVDPDGSSFAMVLPEGVQDMGTLEALVATRMNDRESVSSTGALGGRLFQINATPIRLPEHAGWVVVGSELDMYAALDISALSAFGLQIAFLYRDNPVTSWQVAAATDLETPLSEALLRAPEDALATPGTIQLEGRPYVSWEIPLESLKAEGEVSALLFQSKGVAYGFFQDLTLLGALLAGLAVMLMIVGSYFVARGVSRPLATLADAADTLARGQYYSEDKIMHCTGRDEIATLTRGFAHMVSAVRQREEHITHQSLHDPETGLPNRLSFEASLGAQMAKCKVFAVLVITVANLGRLRSTLATDDTTRLMQGVATRLSDHPNDGIASLSYGSFALILKAGERLDSAAKSLQQAFSAPVPLADVEVDIQIRIGGADFPDDGDTVGALIRHAYAAADMARSAPERCAHYDEALDTARIDTLSMMSDLRRGLAKGEVHFAYQPKLELATGRIKGAEALVRWISPKRGFVPPDDFISFAESTGEIRHLTEWGLKTVIAQAAAWKAMGHHLRLGFNLSANDLMNRDLPARVEALLAEHELSPDYLYLEVTESAVVQDIDRALDVMRRLTTLGIELAIDDYGTGYSSLSYLKTLPVTELKIDKAFVLRLAEDEADNILVRSTINLAHKLGLKVTAEGVEDEVSLNRLRAYGCDYIQGFHIARPMPGGEFIEKVSAIERAAS